MILTLLINMVSFLFAGLETILPIGTLPSQFSDALNTVVYAVNGLSYLLPIGDIVTCLKIVVAYELIVWGYYGVLWLWKRVPFIGR